MIQPLDNTEPVEDIKVAPELFNYEDDYIADNNEEYEEKYQDDQVETNESSNYVCPKCSETYEDIQGSSFWLENLLVFLQKKFKQICNSY